MKKVLIMGISILLMFSVLACSKEEEEKETQPDIEYSNDDTNLNIQNILSNILGNNSSSESIIYDLTLSPIVGNNKGLKYEVLKNDATDAKGKLTGKNEEAEDVTVRVTIQNEDKYFKFTVVAQEEVTKAKFDIAVEQLMHNKDNIRGNITLPEKTGNDDEISVEWTSSNTEVITDKATGTKQEFPAGVVTRQSEDTKVTLTAKMNYKDKSEERDIEVVVKSKPADKKYDAYIYTYFRGNIYGNGESQHIHAAVSEDGFHWNALNGNEAILKAELGTQGVRDSFLIRSPEGDRFYLIGTDLDANGGDWGSYASRGSKYIRVWESDDLVNWSEERLIEIAPLRAGCMWAPETYYDETTGEYVVYWATGLNGGNGKKIYYAKTRDFWTFTEPQIYKDVENGITFIDTTMLEYQGIYYRFTKNENEISLLLETSDAVLGEYDLVRTRIGNEFGVEGPAIYQINGQEKWCLYMDGYANGNAGVGYFPLIAESVEDLKAGNFRRLKADEYEMPKGAKHGSFVPITKEEFNALKDKWGIDK